MRIVIDMQGAQTESRFRGIGRYTLALAKAIVEAAKDHEIHLILNGLFPHTINPIREEFDGALAPEFIHVWYSPSPIRLFEKENSSRQKSAELIRAALIESLNPDIVHVSSFFEGYTDDAATNLCIPGCLTTTSLYDLIPLIHQSQYLDSNQKYKDFYLEKLEYLKKFDALFCISQSSAEEARDYLGIENERLFDISAGLEKSFRVTPQSSDNRKLASKVGINKNFIMYTGGSDERKNLRRLIQAFALLPIETRENHQLVLVGRMDAGHVIALEKTARSSGLTGNDVLFTGYIDDEHLVELINQTTLFVFPSWHEGFGLPALEAMACGAPTIAANTSSIPEIIEYEAALFDPFDTEDISRKMLAALTDEGFRSELKQYALQRSRHFTWERVASKFIAACESLLKHQPRQGSTRCDLADSLISAIAKLPHTDESSLVAAADAIDRSLTPFDQKRILVDVSVLANEDYRTGIQRVTRAILKELITTSHHGFAIQPIRIDRENGCYIYANQFAEQLTGEPTQRDSPLTCYPGDIFLGLDLVGDCVARLPEWFSYFRRSGVKISFVVYDILPIRHPQWWPEGGAATHQRWLSNIVDVSDSLICISRSVADEVSEWIDANRPEAAKRPLVSHFHLGADIHNSTPSLGVPEDAEKTLQQIADRPSFLMVSTLEPRKGHLQALDAFEQLWAEGIDVNLVIVGKRGWMVEKLLQRLDEHVESGSRLLWLEAISDEYLEKIYAASTCLLAASEGEGFGLPLIEAAQHNTPVIARDIPVFREVADQHAMYFSGKHGGQLATVIREWLALYRSGIHPDSSSLPWLTWEQSSKQLLDALLKKPGKVDRKGSNARL